MKAEYFAHSMQYSPRTSECYLKEIKDLLYQSDRFGKTVNQNLFNALSFLYHKIDSMLSLDGKVALYEHLKNSPDWNFDFSEDSKVQKSMKVISDLFENEYKEEVERMNAELPRDHTLIAKSLKALHYKVKKARGLSDQDIRSYEEEVRRKQPEPRSPRTWFQRLFNWACRNHKTYMRAQAMHQNTKRFKRNREGGGGGGREGRGNDGDDNKRSKYNDGNPPKHEGRPKNVIPPCPTCGRAGHEADKCRFKNHPERNKDNTVSWANSTTGKA
jgi:hypothetical protein